MKVSISKRYLLLALGLVLVAGIVWADAARRFVKAGAVKAPDISEVAVNDGGGTDAWNLLFERRVPPKEQFAVITEKNVFSPFRKAWAPPPPPPPAEEAVAPTEEKPAEEPPKRDDIELRGTAMVGAQRKAILGFKTFRPPQTMLLGEGEVASEKEIQDGPKFTVVRIESESVRIKDGVGREFMVGLYDHRRQAPEATVNQSTVEVAPQAAPQPAAAAPATAGVVVGGGSASTPATPEAKIQRIQERNEQLVKEGKMKKIDTPFGPVYRKQ